MHGNLSDIERLKPIINLSKHKKFKNVKIIYCPPFTLINQLSKKLKNSKIFVGAQNCHKNSDNGPFTGSINCKMLKSAGAKFVIVGHSENREKDNNSDINKKIKSALKEKLNVIFCIGETFNEKKKKLTKLVLKKQINIGLKNIKKINNILIAYEPRWSIGTGVIPKNSDLKKTLKTIRDLLISKNKNFKKNKILYGGSVNSKNVREIVKIQDIKGLLVGGASLKPKKFIDIIKKSIN